MNEIQVPSGDLPPPTLTSIIPPQQYRADRLQWITYISSLTVILVAAGYLIGFIVVNSALFKYGMVPYDFLQPRYISAGLLYLAATAGFSGVLFFLVHLTKNKHLLADRTNGEIKSAWVFFLSLPCPAQE